MGCNPGYIFRGELAYKKPLSSSLERLVGDLSRLQENERDCVSRFLENGGEAISKIIEEQGGHKAPKKTDVFAWLSIMRHYGKPTRIIDFTRDIRVALFWALEQHRDNGNGLDLYIYCFPCQDPTSDLDPENNKTPFDPEKLGSTVDMNKALGCELGLRWFRDHQDSYKSWARAKRQAWGWDLPAVRNPRELFQHGMFVYPFDYPTAESLPRDRSWLVNSLNPDAPDPFRINHHSSSVPPQRIRIANSLVGDLRTFAESTLKLNKAIAYVDYQRVKVD